MTTSKLWRDSVGWAHEAADSKGGRSSSVMECQTCLGLVVQVGDVAYNAFGYPDTGFYFKKTLRHQCYVRLSRGLGPKRKETK
jgi:hypothetical protein